MLVYIFHGYSEDEISGNATIKASIFYLISEPVFIHMGISLTPDVSTTTQRCDFFFNFLSAVENF
jgi:hypothetical protein